MIFYCPSCWCESTESIGVCPHCNVDVERLTQEQDYVQKLIAALNHPEPETPIRVAWILGVRGETRAIPRLSRLVQESQDPYIVAAAVEALGKIGDPAGLEAVRFALRHGGVRVRNKARRAIELIEGRLSLHQEGRS